MEYVRLTVFLGRGVPGLEMTTSVTQRSLGVMSFNCSLENERRLPRLKTGVRNAS